MVEEVQGAWHRSGAGQAGWGPAVCVTQCMRCVIVGDDVKKTACATCWASSHAHMEVQALACSRAHHDTHLRDDGDGLRGGPAAAAAAVGGGGHQRGSNAAGQAQGAKTRMAAAAPAVPAVLDAACAGWGTAASLQGVWAFARACVVMMMMWAWEARRVGGLLLLSWHG
eukprot:1144350-Pelagomonas_calceolata.AAC.3